MNKFLKLIFIPYVIFAAAFSWLTYIFIGSPKDKAFDYLADWWGWTSPAMEEHWHDFWHDTEGRGWFHEAKNLASEWVRLDAQRAAKAFSFIYVLTVLILLGIIAAILIW